MRLEAKKLLFDMLQAAKLLEEFASGKSYDQYVADAMLRSAVERQFGIIGEAMNNLRKINEQLAASLSEHRRIITFRNVLIHGYDTVSHELVWDILEHKLPTLRDEIETLLSSEP